MKKQNKTQWACAEVIGWNENLQTVVHPCSTLSGFNSDVKSDLHTLALGFNNTHMLMLCK